MTNFIIFDERQEQMETFYQILSTILILSTIIPWIPNQHWFFRVFDFVKIQLAIIQTIVFCLAFLLVPANALFYLLQALLLACIVYELFLLLPYTPIYPKQANAKKINPSKTVDIISANVYQFNTDYQKFTQLINRHQPDLILTMESDENWQKAMQVFKKDYPYFIEIPLANTYGMHFYSKIKIASHQILYLIAEDIPSIEVKLTTSDGYDFVLFGVHPPPPSPTEEENSKERDGELLAVAKRAKNTHLPTLVVGDFNNVAWGKSSKLFKKTAEMIDPRIGRGFISTFHAKYRWLRFPIDQMYHTADVFIENICTQENFGSDHLPLYASFFIDKIDNSQEDEVEIVDAEEKKEVDEMIVEGKKENGEREKIATE